VLFVIIVSSCGAHYRRRGVQVKGYPFKAVIPQATCSSGARFSRLRRLARLCAKSRGKGLVCLESQRIDIAIGGVGKGHVGECDLFARLS